jgi:hypothetical protein
VRRLGGFLGLSVLAVLLTASPAAAVFTTNTIGCAGSAVITDGATTYNADANDSVIKLPKQGSAAYQGSIQTVTHNHSGAIKLKVGVVSIPMGSWGPTANNSNQSASAGVKKLPSALGSVPPGKYDLTGYHKGDEGMCAGKATVEIGGSALASPAALGSLALTALTGVGLLAAFKAKAAAVVLGGVVAGP